MTGRTAGAFRHALRLPGWSVRSAWGFDAELECFWAELWRGDADAEPAVRVAREHLVPTLPGLARVLGLAAGLPAAEAFVALTAAGDRPDRASGLGRAELLAG